MPRQPRLLLSKSFYHIMTRGNNRNVVFKTDNDYFYYLKLLQRFKSELDFDLYHYCLMPNHVHMLIQTKKSKDFSLFMKKINLAYFHHFHRKYGWIGHFWQDRFKSQPVGKDEYFIQCGKYIELNPVRKGLVKKPENWHFSSYNFYTNTNNTNTNNTKDSLLTKDFLYPELEETDDARRKQYQKIIIDEIVKADNKRNVWGSPEERYNEKDKEIKYFKRHKNNVSLR